ncbi:site-specific recombinase Gcr [Apibacter muscae]|uniref:site-specific recombinase Gcr n=1 Tax=Apibacter muscae TaxID=2509004 RepID=UPI0011ABD01B|nr:site-specific recombinase Gcr [Apibacter muscae]TWP28048.1 site-specific recombinase Gcr [Apibacter muscae]
MEEKIEKILSSNEERNFLLSLLRVGRKDFENSIEFIDFLTETIKNNPIIKEKFNERLKPIFRGIRMQRFITDFGIFSDDKIIPLLFRELGNKILPQISDDQTLLSLTNEVLYSRENHNFVKLIPVDRWANFYEALFNNDNLICNREYVKKQIREGALILIDRIVGGAADTEIFKMGTIKSIEENPFQKLDRNLIKILQDHDIIDIEKVEGIIRQIQVCSVYLDSIIDQKEVKGISLKITIKITLLKQQLERIKILVNALHLLDDSTISCAMANITKNWLGFYSTKSKVSNTFQSTLYVVASLITWHNKQTGEKYITSTTKEYMKMLYSAMGGGLLVAILCFIKTQMGMGIHTPFFQALLYSLNYAWGFTAIYLMHWSLATKQPAMTAAALAHALSQDEKSDSDYKEFGIIFSRLFRSQFIAFIGNVLAVFVVAIILFYALSFFTNLELINNHKANDAINELVNLDPKIFWFAAIAGLFLFLSGLVTGITDNYTRYNNIPERLYNHPLLKRFVKETKRRKWSNWYKNNIGGISGNVIFGFCLGSSFLIGNFLGIPFDIRHITFSAGNYAIALAHFNFEITWQYFILGCIGIFGIGALNFLVSFSLSLWLAMKSVNVPTREIGKILYSALKLFLKNPVQFFIPIRSKKNN